MINLEKALIECSDNSEISSSWENNNFIGDSSTHLTLPYFLDENYGIGFLIDLLLVNWPNENMLSTNNTRATIRRFAEDAFRIIKLLFFDMDVHFQRRSGPYESERECLNNQMELSWFRRAQLFYDGRNGTLLTYINHLYSLDYHLPYTMGDTTMFIIRRNVNYNIRYLPAIPWQIQRIESIYPRDPNFERNGTESIMFSIIARDGMTSDDYYYLSRRIQFFRVLFLFIELHRRHLLLDGEDYEVPDDLREMFLNDTAYSTYLLDQRREFLNVMSDTHPNESYWQNLATNPRVSEIDLVMVMMDTLSTNNISTNVSTTTTSTPEISSTTLRSYKRPSGKYGNNARKKEKHGKQNDQRTLADRCYGIGFNKIVTNSLSRCSDLQQNSDHWEFANSTTITTTAIPSTTTTRTPTTTSQSHKRSKLDELCKNKVKKPSSRRQKVLRNICCKTGLLQQIFDRENLGTSGLKRYLALSHSSNQTNMFTESFVFWKLFNTYFKINKINMNSSTGKHSILI